LAKQDLKDREASLDQWENKDQEVHKDCGVKEDLSVNQVPLVTLDPLDDKENEGNLVLLDNLDLPDNREHRVNEVCLVHKDSVESLVPQGNQEKVARQGRQVHLDHLVSVVKVVCLDLRARGENQVQLDPRVYLGHPDHEARGDQWARWVHQVYKDREAVLDHLVARVPPALLDL